MIYKGFNGTMMISSESEVVQNNFAYRQLERFLISLSAKYGLGEVLFLEKNPKNNNATDSFYIMAPKIGQLNRFLKYGIAFLMNRRSLFNHKALILNWICVAFPLAINTKYFDDLSIIYEHVFFLIKIMAFSMHRQLNKLFVTLTPQFC